MTDATTMTIDPPVAPDRNAPHPILDLPMERNDAKAKTIRAYLKALLTKLWIEEEGFGGKRPFGNSGWQHDVYAALVRGKVLKGEIDEDGYADGYDSRKADKLILQAIKDL